MFDILEYIVEQGNMNTWLAISSKTFLLYIIDILKSQNDAEIQTKLLQLIQNWGTDFEINKNVIPNFYKVYNKFKVNGVVFPPREEPNYYKYILRNEGSKQNNNRDYYEDKKNVEHEEEISPNKSNADNEFAYIDSIKNKLKPSNFEHKYRRLISFLVKMHDNIELANICIDKRKISELKGPIDIIKKGNKTIMETISSGRLKDEKLMEITLGTTEDISQTLSREEELKKGNRPNFFTSYFVLNEIIPIKNKNIKSRAKSEKKKGLLNPRNNFNINDENRNNNNTNINDIFELFSSTKPKEMNVSPNYNTNLNNNTNNNQYKMISNYYTNKNINNNAFDDINNDKNNLTKNYRINNNINSSKSLGQNNNDNKNSKINTFDLLAESLYINNQPIREDNINQNNNFNLDMYGPAPETNSNQLVNYIELFNNNNNNYNNGNNNNNNYINSNDNFNNISNNVQYPSFEGKTQINNMLSKNNQGNNNIMDQNYDNNNGQKMTQEEIEREQRLKELDDLF